MVNCAYCHKDFERKTARGVSNRKIYCSTYCQQKSSYERIKKYFRERNLELNKSDKKECVVCGKNIMTDGDRKRISKYCSNKCMFLADRIKKGQKTMYVKIPIEEYLKNKN